MGKLPEQLFPLIMDSINDGVFTVGPDYRITSFNAAAEQISGIDREDAIGTKCHDVFKANICQNDCAMRHTLETGQPRRDVKVDILNADMEQVPIEVTTAALRDQAGEMIGGVEVFRDVSDVEILRSELSGRPGFAQMVGRSAVMRELYAIVPQVAQSDVPVLVRGASGTGKELVASAIHGLSVRKDGPFIRVNCGALPDSLLESELFGHAKGAFTGATTSKPGRFTQADGGTLFLDEIGDISSAFQVKLLRALEEGEIQPLGDTRTIKVDVRLICATNRDLEAMVATGTFREDLYYRIRVVPLVVPTLDVRRDDIPLLVDHFAKVISTRTGRQRPVFSPRALRLLYDYDYPGNVRELRNIIERAFVLCSSDTIEPACLPPEVVRQRVSGSGGERGDTMNRTAPETSSEEAALRRVLDTHGWNREAAAAALGISRTTLWRRMKQLGLV